LLLPPAAEACPMGLAPTTSTTMQMALGDALAVAMLTRRGFTEADFRGFHPGGRLGARLRRVRDLMHAGDAVPLALAGTAMDRALVLMTEKRFGCLGVTNAGGGLLGIITDGDLRRAMGPELLTRTVNEVMTRAPRTIGPDALAAEALHAMNARDRPVTALFVVGPDSKVVGILHIHDLLRAGLA
jgi:arabinose-5-phosphate isomerase